MSKTLTIGKVALTPKGLYSPTAQYEELDVVRYEGRSFVVNKPCSGITPVEGEYYTLLAEKGDQGVAGAAGPGLPTGGAVGQVPVKKSTTNYDTEWKTLTPGDIGAAAASHGTHVTYGTGNPVMDGTASAGTATTVSRSDHKHPTDTSRAAANHDHNSVYYQKSETYSKSEVESKIKEIASLREGAEHYAFTISDNESACGSKVTYPAAVDNADYIPAGVNGSTFSYGSWANAFFIKNLRVVMLNFDGTEAYEINKNNYKKKVDGTDVGTEGNVMVAIPKVYYKVVDNGNGTATVHVSNVALDSDYHCWSHIGLDGKEKDYCYMAAYNGSWDNSKLRSLTGQTPMVSQTAQTEINRAVANNTDANKKNWYTGVAADRFLIQILLLLIGKNTNTQAQFGNGNVNTSAALATGTMDTKGLFWGTTANQTEGVKVFGIEHFWGNVWNRTAGWINDKGVEKIKMTYGTEDGSTVTGYNLTGDGYVVVGTVPSSFWIKSMYFHKFGLVPKAGDGSATTCYADYCWTNNAQVNYALVGGSWDTTTYAGAFDVHLTCTASYTYTSFGASLSYKQG